jgi:HPt (histidine-containing phosphotransfer) domain-containing protein
VAQPSENGLAKTRGRVLIVEASRTIGLLAVAWLKQEGWAADHVSDAPAAAAAISETRFDVLVVDPAVAQPETLSSSKTSGRQARVVLADGTNLGRPFQRQALVAAVAEALRGHPADQPLIDTQALQNLWSPEDEALLHQVIGLFFIEAESRLHAIDCALAPLDRACIKREGHSLKGGAANICATRLHSLALWLEGEAETGSESELARGLELLRQATAETRTAFRAMTRGGAA